MLLSDKQIAEAYRSQSILIDPFDEDQIEAASYDLRVGPQGITSTSKKIIDIRKIGFITIAPGDFAVVTVLEEIRMGPQHAARFGLRSKYARKGLIATTGAQIDPGYHGRLVVGLTNLSPRSITLSYKDSFVSVEFHRLEEPTTKPYSGPFQDKLGLGPEEIEFVTESEGMAFSEVLTTLRALSSNVGALAQQVKTFEKALWIGLTIIGILVTLMTVVVMVKH